MGRRLLFFPILRTRSARKKLVFRSVIVFLGTVVPAFAAGCEDAPWPFGERERSAPELPAAQRAAEPNAGDLAGARQEAVRRAAKELAELEVEAGIEEEHDPPAPGGDLAHDIEAFTTLDACVRAHRVGDPVLADAVDSLGYDTLVRDACRTLQALHAKDAKLCAPIAASSLRQRCEAQVAVVTGQPAVCPLAHAGASQARDPVCLARASRDERLCAAAMPADRATCKALVGGEPRECGGDQACVRQVQRYRSLIEKPANHAPYPVRLHVELAGDTPKAQKYEGNFDLDEVAAGGAVARPIGDKVRLTVGAPRNGLWPSPESAGAKPMLYLALSLPNKVPTSAAKEGDGGAGWLLGPADVSFDLLVPQIALLSGTLSSERRVEVEAISAASGGPVRLTFTTKVNDMGRTFRVKIDLETFVRDGVDPRPGVKSR
jgi:hypothetical protein